MKDNKDIADRLSVVLNDILGLSKYLNSVLPKTNEQNNPPSASVDSKPAVASHSVFGESLRQAFTDNPGESHPRETGFRTLSTD